MLPECRGNLRASTTPQPDRAFAVSPARARRGDLAATVIRLGHIVGPGWAPLNPAGHFNPQVFRDIRAGKPLALPNFGLETVHHVHADDVAQVVMGAIENRGGAVGEAFNAVSPAAVTLRHYAEAMYRYWGQEPRAAPNGLIRCGSSLPFARSRRT